MTAKSPKAVSGSIEDYFPPISPDSAFEGQALELFDRQREEQVDPPAEREEGVPEGGALHLVAPFHLGRVGHAPVGQHRLAGEEGQLSLARSHTVMTKSHRS